MSMSKLLPALAAAALLTACEARFGNDAGEVVENATPAGRAEDGRLTVEAPGFNMSITIPKEIRAGANDDNDLVYPGSTFGGIHVQGTRERPDGESEGEVEMRFSTADGPERVVAWYRDPARAKEIKIVSAGRQGADFVIAATGADGDGGRISIRISPRAGGGSEARLLLSERK